MEDAPAPQADRLRLLASIIADDGPFAARVQNALREAAGMMGYDIGLLSHVAGDDYTVIVAHAPGTEIVPGSVFPVTDTYCVTTLETGGMLEIPHADDSDFRTHPCHQVFGLESYVGIPVRVDGADWGTLNFSSPAPRAERLSESDRDLIRLLAVWVGGVLERETRDRRIAEEAGRLAAVVDQAPIIVYGINARGEFTLSEGAGLAAIGLEPGQVVGQSVFELYAQDPISLDAIGRVLNGDVASWEVDQGDVVFSSQARPVRGPSGEVTGLIGVSFDVTAEAESRRALAESETRLRVLSTSTYEGIAFSEGGVVFDGNEQFARLFGYANIREVVGQQPADLVADEYLDLVETMVREGRTNPYEAVCVRADGTRFWAEIQGQPTPYDGRTVRMTAVRDITARKRAEEQRRFQADVLAHVSDAVVALDLDGRITYWNDGATALHGQTSDEVLGRQLEDVVRYIVPEHSDDERSAEQALRSEAARSGELVFIGPGGERRFVSVSSSLLLDDAGAERGLLAVSRDVTAQREMSAELRHQATHDALTGLPNRTLFRDRISAALEQGEPFAVLFVDLDRFKVVNDSLGHDAGDTLLKTVALRLRGALGAVPDAVVARLGGDEFGILAPNEGITPQDIGQVVLDALAPALDLGPRAVSPAASVGVVAHAEAYDAPEAILRDADTAMYTAKHQGRGRLALFTAEMHRQAALRFQMEHDLPYAAGRDQLRLYLQPIVDLATGTVAGFEALVRWHHPEMGLLTPGHFLPLAEELGLVVDLDRWILDAACAEVAGWGAEALDALSILSVNCSDRTFLGPDLADHARAAADLAGLPPGCLVLELTERALVDFDPARDVVEAAQRNGLQVAVDDFGAGYSSLGLLHALPVDGVKIDRSFVWDLEGSRRARAIVRGVVGLSEELGMRAIGEGVETPGQLRALRDAGARFAQGFLFAKPVPASQARAMLAEAPWAGSWDAWTRDETLALASEC